MRILPVKSPSHAGVSGGGIVRQLGAAAAAAVRGHTRRRHRAAGGFTLVEILIVVIILGILAAITLPQFSNASHVTRENTLKDDLRYLRSQIVVYQAQHDDKAPGFQSGALGGDPAALFVQQMTQCTDQYGNCNGAVIQGGAFTYGPYLSKMPPNPLTGDTSIEIITGQAAPTPDNTTGWIYNPVTGTIVVNSTQTDTDGTPYATY